MGYSSRVSSSGKCWSKATLGDNFIIGIVEIINKAEYKKDPGCNIVVVTEEEDMILRYIMMYSNG